MPDAAKAALDILDQQVKELDAILKQAKLDLNTVAGGERVAKWKARAIPVLSQHLGEKHGQRLAQITPGLTFTNDFMEEFSEEVEEYRNCLMAMVKELKKAQ